jgi:putative oxidoreductase
VASVDTNPKNAGAPGFVSQINSAGCRRRQRRVPQPLCESTIVSDPMIRLDRRRNPSKSYCRNGELMKTLFATTKDHALALARLVLGIVFFMHGAQVTLGWFGGHGFHGTMAFFTHVLGVPAPFAFLAIMAQFLGGLGLIVGFLSRIAAFGIAADMVVAVLKVHFANGFFMNWFGNQKGEGYEYHLLVIAIAILIMVKGAGALSIDRLLGKA